ncbi:MAG: preprotein translocase subunit SecG [Candidatus Ryanbacteria bacterium]|nr:preprotein translocase subunit SecG [Candidatus Ryanbacteria bacterium]
MPGILPYIQIVLSVLIIGAILLQQRGAGAGSAFGSGSTTYGARRGSEKILFYVTIALSILFFVATATPLFLQS